MGEYSGFGRGGRFGAAARRKPSPIPRNEPRSTKFEKYARWTMFAPSHRISESSINSISALPRSRRTRGGMRAEHARADLPAANRRGPPVGQQIHGLFAKLCRPECRGRVEQAAGDASSVSGE